MTSSPRFSFLLCTRNRAEIARRCVENLLASPREDIEVVVRDNCSTDNTLELLRQINDPRLKIHVAPENQGTRSFFEISRLATGNIVTWLSDEDDFYLGEIDFILGKFDSNPDCNVMFGSIIVGPSGGRVAFNEEVVIDPVRAHVTALSFSGCGGLFVRRSALPAANGVIVEDSEQAYMLWNYYPVGFFASRCVSDNLITTSRTTVVQTRFAHTTHNWSKTSRNERGRLPHYYPESVFERLCSNLANAWMKNTRFKTRLATSCALIRLFVLQQSQFSHPATVALLNDNYDQAVVQTYVSHIRRLYMDRRFGRYVWITGCLLRAVPRSLSTLHTWRQLQAKRKLPPLQ